MITTKVRLPIFKGFSEDDIGKSAQRTEVELTNDADELIQNVKAYFASSINNDPVTIYRGSDGVITYTNETAPKSRLTSYIRLSAPNNLNPTYYPGLYPATEFDVRLKYWNEFLSTFPNALKVSTSISFIDLYSNFIGASTYFYNNGDIKLVARPLNDKLHVYICVNNNERTIANPMPDKFMSGEWVHVKAYKRQINGSYYSIIEVDNKAVLTIPLSSTSILYYPYIGSGGLSGSSSNINNYQPAYIEVSNISLTGLFETEIDENQNPVELQIGD